MPSLPWIPNYEAFIRKTVADSETPGLAIAVAIAGEPVYEAGFGFRDVQGSLPATPATVFGIGSVTKSFTAMAIMQLDDEGRLSVANPIVKYLPRFRLPGGQAHDEITIHHLLCHASGLPAEPALVHGRAASMRRDPDAARLQALELPADFFTPEYAARDISTVDELVSLLPELDFTMLGAPGRYFSYSNEGYALLQGIVEQVSGKPIVEYWRQNIWEPLGMKHTGTQAEAIAGFPEVTTLHGRVAEGVVRSPAWHDIGGILGNGGLASDVRDLLRWLEVFRNEGTVAGAQIASPAAIEKMTTPKIEIPTGGSYGYGLQLRPGYHGVDLVGHGGAGKGIAAHVGIVRAKGLTTAVLTNLQGAPAAQVSWGAANLSLGLLAEAPIQDFPSHEMSSEKLAEYAGTYEAERQKRRFYVQDGFLNMEGNGQMVAVRPFAEDCFVLPGELPTRFLRDEAGAVWANFQSMRLVPRTG